MTTPDLIDRATGALMGAFIGDALALGPHWYYDLDEMRRDYGPWISTYTAPRPGRYHAGLPAGAASQSGILLALTLQSLVSSGGYDEADFCRRLDEDFFPQLDGEPMGGPGGYTSQSIRESWRKRVQQGLPWGQVSGNADTTEALERVLAIAVRYATRPSVMADAVFRNALLTQHDETVLCLTVAFSAVLGQLVQGYPLDGDISGRLMALVKRGELPFHTVTSGQLQAPVGTEARRVGGFPSPDALLSPGYMARAARDPEIRIEPAWKVSVVYGMPCAAYHVLPAAYYLAARFDGDFESAVLHAVNGGGQNLARAMLTGALAGARCGLAGIPAHLLEGLQQGPQLLAQVQQMVEWMAEEA